LTKTTSSALLAILDLTGVSDKVYEAVGEFFGDKEKKDNEAILFESADHFLRERRVNPNTLHALTRVEMFLPDFIPQLKARLRQ
jgi:hypothetical protein